MLGIDASRTSYGQGQGQGQSSDIRNGQQLGNTNPNINHILYQPNNSPSIIIGLDQNDSSKGKNNDFADVGIIMAVTGSISSAATKYMLGKTL